MNPCDIERKKNFGNMEFSSPQESLRRVLQEKLEAVTKLSDLEQSLGNMTSECGHLKQLCELTQGELATLALKYQDQLQEVQTLTDKLQVMTCLYYSFTLTLCYLTDMESP